VAKLSDAEGEAAETQVWMDYAVACEYISQNEHKALDDKYDHILVGPLFRSATAMPQSCL